MKGDPDPLIILDPFFIILHLRHLLHTYISNNNNFK